MIRVAIENLETGEKNVYTGDYVLGCTGSIDEVLGLASGSIFADGVSEENALKALEIFYKEMKKAIKLQIKKGK